MAKSRRELQSLIVPIEQKIESLVDSGLGYKINRINCRLLESLDFAIHIERAYSATEKLLLAQQKEALAHEIGFTINLVLKNRLTFALAKEFDLTISDISFVRPTFPDKIDLLVLLDAQPMASLAQTVSEKYL